MSRVIPIASRDPRACDGEECFALRVLGGSMAPEFVEGDVVVIEPGGLAADGAFVLAHAGGEWVLRRLVARAPGWRLDALDPAFAPIDIAGLDAVRGVVVQKSRPGRRREAKFYGSAGREPPRAGR